MIITQAPGRAHHPEEKNPLISRHCQKCWRKRPHRRSVRDGQEILTCTHCGTEQFYTYTAPAAEEE